MTKTQVEVITSVQRRRRWPRAEKERLVAAALEPGVVASEVAREAGIHTSQLFRWRQELCKRAPAPVAFNPVAVAPVHEAAALPLPVPSPEQAGTVEIEFATGGRMRITGSVDSSTVSVLLKALAKAVCPGPLIMSGILYSLSLIGRRLGGSLSKKEPRPAVVDHDPAADRPHDLDDPFFDAKVQRRVAEALAASAQDKSRREC
jgi:transposase